MLSYIINTIEKAVLYFWLKKTYTLSFSIERLKARFHDLQQRVWIVDMDPVTTIF